MFILISFQHYFNHIFLCKNIKIEYTLKYQKYELTRPVNMEMYGMETKVNDVKTQETAKKPTVNHETPTTTKEKVDVNTVTIDDLKQLIKDYKYIKTKISKLGELVIELDGANLVYISPRKYGLGFQINADNKWVTQRIVTNKQLQNKVEKMKELHNANKRLLQLRKELVTG